MPCILDACECRVKRFPIQYCAHWAEPEKPLDAVEIASIQNWCLLPLITRQRCLAHLRRAMHDHPKVLERWRDQAKRKVAIGSDDLNFHHGAGTAVRNILRQVLTDDKLPPVIQPDGTPGQNWDDFYYGAIEALVFPTQYKTVREAAIADDPDWVAAYRIIDLFSASGPGATRNVDPHKVLAAVKEIRAAAYQAVVNPKGMGPATTDTQRWRGK